MGRNDYHYEKQRRESNYAPIYLSEKDEYIPKTHIGMYSLLRNEKNESIYMSESQCQKVRQKTYDGIFAIYQKYNSPSFADLWNYNITAINDGGLNYMINNPNLAPIGDLIQCFEYQTQANYYKSKRIISFGIDRELLKQYFVNVEEAKKTGSKVNIPKLQKPGNKTREQVIFGEDTVMVENGTFIIPRNAVYNRFLHWCELQGVEKDEGLLMALQSLFKIYPLKELNEVDYYHVVTELDRNIFYEEPEIDTKRYPIKLSGEMLRNIKSILRRYNSAPENADKKNITVEEYINNAIYFMNKNMPLKYSNPRLAKEKELTEKMEADLKGLD